MRPGCLTPTYRLAVALFRNNAAYIRREICVPGSVPGTQYFPQFLEDVRTSDAVSFADPVITSIKLPPAGRAGAVHTPVLAVAGKKSLV